MNGLPPLPSACRSALARIQAEPLQLPAVVAAHVRTCHTCSEARVAWLAQEEAGPVLTPAGYFDQLPGRILGKLPTRRRRAARPLFWAAAASLLLAAGLGGFRLGQSEPATVTEASLPAQPVEAWEMLLDAPFQALEEEPARQPALSQEELLAVLERLAPGDSQPAS